MIPNYYLQYYYQTDHKLDGQDNWPPSRGEEVIEIERNLLREYADPALNEPPADLMLRGGAYYSTVATQLLNAHFNDMGETHVVNIRHNGAVPGWPTDWVLEMPARVDRKGIHPLPAEPLPTGLFRAAGARQSLRTVDCRGRRTRGQCRRPTRPCLPIRSAPRQTRYRQFWMTCSRPIKFTFRSFINSFLKTSYEIFPRR